LGLTTARWRYAYLDRCYLGGSSYYVGLSSTTISTNTGLAVGGNISGQTISATTELYASSGRLRLASASYNPSAAGEIRNYSSGGTQQFRGRPGSGTWVGSFDMTAY